MICTGIKATLKVSKFKILLINSFAKYELPDISRMHGNQLLTRIICIVFDQARYVDGEVERSFVVTSFGIVPALKVIVKYF